MCVHGVPVGAHVAWRRVALLQYPDKPLVTDVLLQRPAAMSTEAVSRKSGAP